jgi:hypothetical protein
VPRRQKRSVGANVLNNQSRTANKRPSSCEALTTPRRKKIFYEFYTRCRNAIYHSGKKMLSSHFLSKIITNPHLDRLVSTPSNSLFKGFPRHIGPFSLKFSIIAVIPLSFILVTCRSQFDFYLLSLSSAGSTFNSSKMASFLLWPTRCTRLIKG